MKFRSDDLVWREIDGDLVILDLKSSTYFTTNASATVLVKQLTSDRTQPELVQALIGAYGISESQAEQDVLDFLHVLESNGLLVPSGPTLPAADLKSPHSSGDAIVV